MKGIVNYIVMNSTTFSVYHRIVHHIDEEMAAQFDYYLSRPRDLMTANIAMLYLQLIHVETGMIFDLWKAN